MKLVVPVPSSKSITQRALLIAALATDRSVIRNPLACDDSRFLRQNLAALGAAVAWETDSSVSPLEPVAIIDPAPRPLRPPNAPLFCGNAGTAVRFTAPLALICQGALILDGDSHMRKRPIGSLARALGQLGIDVAYIGSPGAVPLGLTRSDFPPTHVALDGSLSSQYASGLLMVAPLLDKGLEIELLGRLVSRPYIDMTLAMMQRAGARAGWIGSRSIRVEPGCYAGGELRVEVDWSAAAFVLAAARITGHEIEPEGLAPPDRSLQGDAAIVRILAALDRAPINEVDLIDAPDLIAPVAAAAAFAARPTRIRGAAHARVKECDRVAVLARELAKVGANTRVHDDGLDIEPIGAEKLTDRSVIMDPSGDHRMAMTFGVVSLRLPSIAIASPECVSKSFPDFWRVLARIRALGMASSTSPEGKRP